MRRDDSEGEVRYPDFSRSWDFSLARIAQIMNGIHIQIETLVAYRMSRIHECVTGQRRTSGADVNRAKALR